MIKHLSFALRLKDGLTGASLQGASRIRFLLDGTPFHPVCKPDGWFAFVNVPPGEHQLEMHSAWFLPEQLSVNVPDWKIRGADLCAILRPSAAHPVPDEVVLLQGTFLSVEGKPEAAQMMLVFGREAFKLSQDGVEVDDAELRLFVPHKSLLAEVPGLFFLEDGENSELCTLLEGSGEIFRLGAPLRFAHKRGTALWMMRPFESDAEGRFLAAYPRDETPRIYVAQNGGFRSVTLSLAADGSARLTV